MCGLGANSNRTNRALSLSLSLTHTHTHIQCRNGGEINPSVVTCARICTLNQLNDKVADFCSEISYGKF